MKKSVDTKIPMEQLVKGKKIPILVLDQRWHKLFPGGRKPPETKELEKRLNDLLKEQGNMVNSIKELKKGKKKLMAAIVANMGAKDDSKKREKQQKLLLETNERIEQESAQLMELPYKIKETNEQLLISGITYCYENWQSRTEELASLLDEIESMRAELKEKVAYRVELEESVDSTYTIMHDLLGREVMDLFDKRKE